MTRHNPYLAAALILAPLVASSPLSAARAQEAIMLETIGAVRMASPDEVSRMNDIASHPRQPQPSRPAAYTPPRVAATD